MISLIFFPFPICSHSVSDIQAHGCSRGVLVCSVLMALNLLISPCTLLTPEITRILIFNFLRFLFHVIFLVRTLQQKIAKSPCLILKSSLSFFSWIVTISSEINNLLIHFVLYCLQYDLSSIK